MELIEVESLASRKSDWEEALIVPVGDVQLGSSAADRKRFRRFIEECLEHPNPWFLGMGDYVDVASPSNRKALKRAIAEEGIYDSFQDMIEAGAEDALEDFVSLCEGTEGRWMGMLSGHHFHEFLDGTTSDMRICNRLGAQFLGTCAMVQLRFRYGGKGARADGKCTIWAHHGRGGGKLASGPLNQLEHITKAFDADIYLVGHHHRQVAARMSRIYPDFRYNSESHRVYERRQIIASTGGYLKGYMVGHKRAGRPEGTYVEKGMMNPVTLGSVTIRVLPTRPDPKGATQLAMSINLPDEGLAV